MMMMTPDRKRLLSYLNTADFIGRQAGITGKDYNAVKLPGS